MKILYDHQIFSSQRVGGVSRYFAELYKGFMDQKEISTDITCTCFNNKYLKVSNLRPGITGRLQEKGIKIFEKLRARMILNAYCNYRAQKIIQKNDFEIFHPTYFNPYFLPILKKPFVITVYDLIYEKYPGYFSYNDYIYTHRKHILAKSEAIIAISEQTKEDIIRYYGIPDKKINVIYLASDMGSVEKGNSYFARNFSYLKDKYILYVGSRQNYKNYSRMINSIHKILLENDELYLICAGGGGPSPAELNQLISYGILGKVMFISDVDEQELADLYRMAKLFIYPSLYEGFGIPILEAMSAGCPVLTSQTSSMPEVGGDAASYMDPSDETSVKKSVEKLIGNEKLRRKMIQNGIKQAGKFSWSKCVTEHMEVYKNIV